MRAVSQGLGVRGGVRCPLLRWVFAACLLTLAAVFPAPSLAAPVTNDLNRAISASRQFVAYAPGPLLPQAIGVFADQVRREWQYRLQLSDQGRDPIVILVRDREPAERDAPSPTVGVFPTALHLKYQVTWLSPPPLDQRGLVRAVVEALCGELANRSQRVERDRPYVAAPIPPWLSVGLARAIRGRDERLLQVARRSLAGGRPLSADGLLGTTERPTDPIGSDLFEAHAGLFTEALLGLPQGAARLAQFVSALGQIKSALDAFQQVYGRDFAAPAALEKWWALELHRRTSLLPARDLTVTETRRVLAMILETDLAVVTTNQPPQHGVVTPVVGETRLPFGELWRYYDKRWMGQTITDKRTRLESLLLQAAPGYRPVINGYEEALEWLRQGKISRFRRAARAATEKQQAIDRHDGAISEYLDQMELVHSPLLKEEDFNAFFRTFDTLEQFEQHRSNPISEYLDKFDRP